MQTITIMLYRSHPSAGHWKTQVLFVYRCVAYVTMYTRAIVVRCLCVQVYALCIIHTHKSGGSIILNIHTPLTHTKIIIIVWNLLWSSRCLWYLCGSHILVQNRNIVVVSQNFDTFIVTGSGRAIPTTKMRKGRIRMCTHMWSVQMMHRKANEAEQRE